ncbi:MAG: S9 family peptidase, partial [bacterium]
MRRLAISGALLLCIFGIPLTAQVAQTGSTAGAARPPVAAKQPKVSRIHGYTRTDDYFWLRDKTNPSVRQYLEAENAYTADVMKPTEQLQQRLYDEMVARIKQTDETAPYRKGDWVYWSRTTEGKQYSNLVRRPVAGGAEQSVLNVNAMAVGHGFYSLGAAVISDDGNLVAYSVDTTGYRQYELHVKDLRTGATLIDHVPRVGSVVWAKDNHTIFVTTEDSITKRSDKFWRHKAGTDSTTLLYDEKDENFDLGAERSRDQSIIFVTAGAKTSAEARYLSADTPDGTLALVLPREAKHEYSVDADAGRFYIRTNDHAKNFRVVFAPIAHPDRAHWTTFIAHNPKVKIENVDFFAGHAVVSERENGLTFLRVIDKKTGGSHRISTPEPVYTLYTSTNAEYVSDSLRFTYNSLVTPPSTFAYNVSTRARTLLKQQDVYNYDPAKFESRRIWVTARDGTKVPVALVFKKGTPIDGSAPMLLYAYGSYGASIDPTFSSNRLSLLDRGFIYALASIRGGGELGEPWREAGRMMKKMNTFTDFIDVADYLEKHKYTSANRMMIQGGSAGGLLMGAVVNMRPTLFKAAIAAVPFVDVMNTMLDPTLPLTTSEYTEWGNPNEKPAYDYMMKYSPYDNVRKQAYPAMLVEVSYNDSQVPYWEGTKFAARIRDMKTDNNQLLVKANLGAGHGGASGRYDRWHEIAFEYAFMINQVPMGMMVP